MLFHKPRGSFREAFMIQVEQLGEVTKFRLARTVLGRGVYFTAAYLADGLMIDTGCSYTVRELTQSLERIHLDLIVNTHSHEDHVAANAVLQNLHRVQIRAHAEALPYLANPQNRRLRPYQILMWGNPVACEAHPLDQHVETEHHTFQVIHTPGHSPDHVCFYEPERGWLFAGDAYVHGRDRALRADYNVWQILASLKKLASLEPKIIFPGSGTARFNASEALAAKIQYLEQTAERVLELHGRGLSASQIRKSVFGREMAIAYITLGHFSGANLVRSFLEHKP
jgi:glyoxylase-like metal-dependent hydrolase (beta-lactamase superfamily II)